MRSLLEGLYVNARGSPGGPAQRGASALAHLGATVQAAPGAEQLWRERSPYVTFEPVRGALEAEYAGLLGALRALHDGGVVSRRATLAGLHEGLLDESRANLTRCGDGWLVVRWRELLERDLLEAALGRPLCDAGRIECWAVARDCRLLVAPVENAPRAGLFGQRITVDGTASIRRGQLRVVDWSTLWAGPWAAGELARSGADVVRVEVASRPDGYRRSAEGSRIFERWDRQKRVVEGDARTPRGLARLRDEIARADVVISNNTPRVLPQLGFEDTWFDRSCPHVFRISLTGYAHPYSDAPALGEQACALAGLFWRGPDSEPRFPRPWADPLLGAWAVLAVRAWDRAGRPSRSHARLSLEDAAARVISAPPPGDILYSM